MYQLHKIWLSKWSYNGCAWHMSYWSWNNSIWCMVYPSILALLQCFLDLVSVMHHYGDPCKPSGPCFWHGLTLIPAWISNYSHDKVWHEITCLFPNFNGATVEVWEWISYFIPHFTGHVITYPDCNRPISQMRATLAACRELALDYNTYP